MLAENACNGSYTILANPLLFSEHSDMAPQIPLVSQRSIFLMLMVQHRITLYIKFLNDSQVTVASFGQQTRRRNIPTFLLELVLTPLPSLLFIFFLWIWHTQVLLLVRCLCHFHLQMICMFLM